jgi:hypothetical protein
MNMIHRAKMPPTAMASVTGLALILGLGLSSCSKAVEQNATEETATSKLRTEQAANEPVMNEQDPSAKCESPAQGHVGLSRGTEGHFPGYDRYLRWSPREPEASVATSEPLLNRPDKIHTTRKAGSAGYRDGIRWEDTVILGQGQNASCSGGSARHDRQSDLTSCGTGSKAAPAPIWLQNVYGELTGDDDVKDLGSGVIGGTECDHFAFRTKETDWQIWIAQGPTPYPCRYVITTKGVDQAPQYTLVVRDWKAGAGVAGGDFAFKPPAGAKLLDAKDIKALKEASDLPENYKIGETK